MDRVERAILMKAAVIGRRFSVSVLTETTSCSEVVVRAALQSACRLQLIVAENSNLDRHMFRHALTRDVIYDELLAGRVRPLHRRVARVLERARHTGNVSLEDLAYHSWAAGDLRRALRYNELAGDNAAAVHAQSDARTAYIRARSASDLDSPDYERLTMKLLAIGDLSSTKAP